MKTWICAMLENFFCPSQGAAYRPHMDDIARAVSDERHNFLIPYYRGEVLPMLNREKPRVVGISITHTSELVPAFTLAYLILE